MYITYQYDVIPDMGAVIDVYKSSGINRPVNDVDRITRMYAGSNLIVTAWHDTLLVGVARAVTDYSYCCYLSDLAVRKEYQKNGIGQRLVSMTKEKAGPESMLLLVAAPAALTYYVKIGMERLNSAFIIKRES